MQVCAIQLDSTHDRQRNLDRISLLIEQAMDTTAPQLIQLPEMYPLMSADQALKRSMAETLNDSPSTDWIRTLAARYHVAIHAGSLLERDGQQLYNSTFVVDEHGKTLAHYRKIHLFDVDAPDGRSYRESDLISAGDQVMSYRYGGWCVGCAICYDLRFATLFHRLRRAGAELICLPSAFTRATGQDHWTVLLRARAIETQCYVLAANQTGPFDGGHSYGHSLLIDPWGRILADAGEAVGFCSGALDRTVLDQVRTAMPVIDHHRL